MTSNEGGDITEDEWISKSQNGEVCGVLGCVHPPTSQCPECKNHYCFGHLDLHLHGVADKGPNWKKFRGNRQPWWAEWQIPAAIDDQDVYIANLSGLDSAKLLWLANDPYSIEKIKENFDNDTKFILGVVDFLTDIDWIKQDFNGTFRMTREGKTNTITYQKRLVNFR